MILKCVQLILSCLMVLGTFSFAFAYYEYERTTTCNFTQPCDEVLTSEHGETMLAKRGDDGEGQ